MLIHTKYFVNKSYTNCRIGLAVDHCKQWMLHAIFAFRSESRVPMIFVGNEPLNSI